MRSVDRYLMSEQQEAGSQRTPGWTTETELVREFDRPVSVTDAVVSTVTEATETWTDLSATPPLTHFVDPENLDGLFKTRATDGGSPPSATFRFQTCRVSVLYGRTVRVIIERES